MKYAAVFFAGMAFPYVAWWTYAALHDYVYMPLVWEPRHRKWCREWDARHAKLDAARGKAK